MKKINFEDGVTKANATTFNQLETNVEEAIDEAQTNAETYTNEKSQRHIITAYNNGSGNQSIEVAETYKQAEIELTASNVVGDKLSLSNNKVVIGSGVSKVLVSGMLALSRGTTSNGVYMQISKNGETISYSTNDFVDWIQKNIVSNEILIDVVEGDEINMFFGTAEGTGTYQIRKGISMTHLTVEVVG